MKIKGEVPLLALGVTLSFFGGACDTGTGFNRTPTPIVRPSAAAGPTPLVENRPIIPDEEQSDLMKKASDLVSKYYPEISDRPIKTIDEIKIGTSNKIINISSADLDADVMFQVIGYFEDLVKSPMEISYKGKSFLLVRKDPNQDHVVFLVDKGEPYPFWDKDLRALGTGPYVASSVEKEDKQIAYVQVLTSEKDADPNSFFIYQSPDKITNNMLTDQIFNLYVDIATRDAESAQIGMMIVPFSFAVAISARQEGFLYQDYANRAKKFSLRYFPDTPAFPLYVLPEEEYNTMPASGFPLKIRSK